MNTRVRNQISKFVLFFLLFLSGCHADVKIWSPKSTVANGSFSLAIDGAIAPGDCKLLTIQFDKNLSPKNRDIYDTALQVTVDGPGQIFDSSNCTNENYKTVIPAGKNTAQVYFKTTSSGSPKIIVLDFFGTHQQSTQTLSVKPLLTDITASSTLTESEYRVVTVVGTWPTDATFSWSSPAGTFSGTGERVNFKLTDGWVAANGTGAVSIEATVTSATGGTTIFSKSLAVSTPRPFIQITSVAGAGTNYTVTGTVSNLTNPALYGIGFHQHSDKFYNLGTAALNGSSQFSFNSNSFSASSDRINLTLYLISAGWPGGSPAGVVNPETQSKIPRVINGTQYFDFATIPWPLVANVNPQAAFLVSRLSADNVPGVKTPARLIQTLAEQDSYTLKAQAWGAMALVQLNEQTQASKILNALSNLQAGDGSWAKTWDRYGNVTTVTASVGPIALAAIAALNYQEKFSDNTYQAMAVSALSYIQGLQQSIVMQDQAVSPIAKISSSLTSFITEDNILSYAAFKRGFAVLATPAYETMADDLRKFLFLTFAKNTFRLSYDSAGNTFDIGTYESLLQALAVLIDKTQGGPNGENLLSGLERNCTSGYEDVGTKRFLTGGIQGLLGSFTKNVATSWFVDSASTLATYLAIKKFHPTFLCGGQTIASLETAFQSSHVDTIYGGVPMSTTNSNTDYSISMDTISTAWWVFLTNNVNPFEP